MSTSLKREFDENGYIRVASLLTGGRCGELVARLQERGTPPDWAKSNAAAWPAYHEIGADACIVDHLAELLGEDVMLWGASLVRRRPGKLHPWHTDIETFRPEGRSVSVWIGLEHTSDRSSLRVVSRSHAFTRTVQEHAYLAKRERAGLTDTDISEWAATYDPESRIETVSMTDGDGVFFHGRLWHATLNTSQEIRTALLLQYAAPTTPIRIPLYGDFEWPLQFLDEPRPQCVMVRGSSHDETNRIVSPPLSAAGDAHPRRSWIKQLALPLDEDPETGWRPHPIYRGPTGSMSRLSCHVSVLSAGRTPHEPHQHVDEEILIMLSGEAELVLAGGDESDPDARRLHPVRRGHFAYYPAGQRHTIRNAGDGPATYLMFKWQGRERSGAGASLETTMADAGEVDAERRDRAFATRRVFEAPTGILRKLHCHVSTLQLGGGYDPHVDAYDVAMVVLDGIIETLGQRVGPNGVIFYAAGEPHGIKNVGEIPARYVVFEFHGTATGSSEPERRRSVGGAAARRAKRLLRRIRRGIRRRLDRSFQAISGARSA